MPPKRVSRKKGEPAAKRAKSATTREATEEALPQSNIESEVQEKKVTKRAATTRRSKKCEVPEPPVEGPADFSECVWKECPKKVAKKRKYLVDEENPRAATKANDGFCTIIGNMPLPQNKVTSWSIKILKSFYNNGCCIYIGIAPSDINQNEDENLTQNGWYFHCYDSTLRSGPPHSYRGKEHGPRKEDGKYIHTGDVVGVVMDTTKSELSFVLNGVNLGIAYEGIPLDKPLVPCVILCGEGDSVGLDTSEVKETKVNSSIPAPSTTVKPPTWDSVTLSWDPVEGASFYQIEADENKLWGASTTNTFTKRGLLPDTEHIFRVRVVCGNEVSEWSNVVKRRTLKESFETSGWKECPDYIDICFKYSVNEANQRVATFTSYGYCTIIGNTPLPLNKVASWSIKILQSKENDGDGIYIGVAPFDINQNEDNYYKCGWYFSCYGSTLYSGPPHNYRKEYGPIKKSGNYIHTGDSVRVVMDTTNGKLSFVVDGINFGVAFDGIPLDKPLVPCVVLRHRGDSVELDTSEVKGKTGACIAS